MELANPNVHESMCTQERYHDLLQALDAFFNPASLLRDAGGASIIGGSDEGKASLYRAYIAAEQTWICNAYRKIIQKCLDNAGLQEYTVELKLPKPEADPTERILQQLQIAIQGTTENSSITDEELRERLDMLDLPEDLPEEINTRRQEAKDAMGGGAFGGGAPEGGVDFAVGGGAQPPSPSTPEIVSNSERPHSHGVTAPVSAESEAFADILSAYEE